MLEDLGYNFLLSSYSTIRPDSMMPGSPRILEKLCEILQMELYYLVFSPGLDSVSSNGAFKPDFKTFIN